MNRTEAVIVALGYQGGTVHDLCKELGIEVNVFLYGSPNNTANGSYIHGLYINTCGMEHRHNVLKRDYYGDLDYWLGVARCYQMGVS